MTNNGMFTGNSDNQKDRVIDSYEDDNLPYNRKYRVKKTDSYHTICITDKGERILPDYSRKTNTTSETSKNVLFVLIPMFLISLGLFLFAPFVLVVAFFLIFIGTMIFIMTFFLSDKKGDYSDPKDSEYFIYYGDNLFEFLRADYDIIEKHLPDEASSWLNIFRNNNISVNENARKDAQRILDKAFEIRDSELYDEHEELVKESEKIKSEKKLEYINENKNDSYISNNLPLSTRITIAKDEYKNISLTFLDYQTNPEHLLYRPLILDSKNNATQNMINSFNRLRESIENNIEENISIIEVLIKNAQESLSNAYERATKVGTPNINERDKRIAAASLRIALDESATREERILHWEKVLDIAKKSELSQGTIGKVNTQTLYEIETGKRHQQLEISQ